ncbi:MAG: 16S rRNA (adenine(1518)-N(6)/adenine(1519)-N(6))-dimethyltransferase RsmA [Patescibacteria group bacterium]|nr:16S rRNA (adenine(1518)-N(6)/adenine(1519)-N(6))-dimethyltransferase RsmA [Patescibacteria group bacterium]
MSVKNVKNLLKSYGIRPLKKLGQNFLINEKVFEKILKTADLSSKDVVLEIGPGIGNLTLKLARKAKKVIAIEKDKKMCEILVQVLKDENIENVQIINHDILKLDISPYIKPPYKLVANLPYYITSPVIRKFLEFHKPPKLIVLMIQKEVAQRICAKPGKMSILAVSVQFYANPKIISYISKKSFWPQPKVDSAIIKIVPKKIKVSDEFVKKFFKIIKAGFSQPRKQLVNNFSKKLGLKKEKIKGWLLENNVKPSQRAETLSVDKWKRLTKSSKIQ